MGLIRLPSQQSLITETSDELLNLASFLEIPADISLEDDHIFIIDKVGALSLGSFPVRRDTDVLIPNQTYSELIIDNDSLRSVQQAWLYFWTLNPGIYLMKLHVLIAPPYLTVDPDSSIVDLAYLLGLDVDVDLSHDHFHIHSGANANFLSLTSYMSPTLDDVRVTPEVFSKILMDIASGMEIKTAFEKQGYTFY